MAIDLKHFNEEVCRESNEEPILLFQSVFPLWSPLWSGYRRERGVGVGKREREKREGGGGKRERKREREVGGRERGREKGR